MSYKILKIEMPKDDIFADWGIIQINNFSNTFFRFEMVDGKPKLDTSFFADQIENPEEKHKYLSPESDLYKGIQKLLDDYVEQLPVKIRESLKCESCNTELTANMEIEYSNQCNAFFCNPSCATNYYFEYMGSTTVDLTDGDGLIEQGIEIVDGKLVKLED